jgi:hypothetical protein
VLVAACAAACACTASSSPTTATTSAPDRLMPADVVRVDVANAVCVRLWQWDGAMATSELFRPSASRKVCVGVSQAVFCVAT